MNDRIAFGLTLPLLLLAVPAYAGAATPEGLVPGDGSATFRFTTAVQTPKGTRSGGGTVTIKRTGTREISLTVQSDDGKPAHTIPLIVGVDGSIAPDPAKARPPSTDPSENAQAKTLMAQMTQAAHVGIGARKNGGGASYNIPVALTPVGTGTSVATTLTMNGTAAQYTGRTEGRTTTQLPPGGGLDPAELAKSMGVMVVAHHAFTPAGRIATAVVMHHKRQEEKKEASGPLVDDMSLNVTANMTGGRIHDIRGTQVDKITLGGKPVDIQSTWSFTKVG